MQFGEDFAQLTMRELSREMKGDLSDEQIKHLIEASAVLSLSEVENHKKLAYKIAVYLLQQYGNRVEAIPFVAELVLTRLGDLPSINFMITKGGSQDYFSYFSSADNTISFNSHLFVRFPEVLEKKAFNHITLSDKRKLNLTDFQTTLLQSLQSKRDIAFSAPTSAGKSFLLLNYIADQLVSQPSFCAIYIVPTKALVAEIQGEVTARLKEFQMPHENCNIFTGSSLLNQGEMSSIQKKLFVLTQERLQEMLSNTKVNFKVDLLVVDEAQQVGNEKRGIVIEDAVQELIETNPAIQNVFVSPYITNLKKFASIFGVDPQDVETLTTKRSPVAQNVFFVTFSQQKEGVPEVGLSILSQELQESGQLNRIWLPFSVPLKRIPKLAYDKKVWVVRQVVSKDEPTLIYCDTPSDCRKVGKGLAEQSDDEPIVSDPLTEAIHFLKDHVHSQYYLADFLKYRIGYHYGTMPQFVRFHIKDLFERGEILYLACTSTLLEGVNLPAKNLVLYKPKKGRQHPMDTLSIRNLFGRAGRLNKDYYGKIYCINVEDEWESMEAFQDLPESVESSSEIVLVQFVDDLIECLRNDRFEPKSGRVRTMATSLLMKQLLHPDNNFLSKFKIRNQAISQEKLDIVRSILIQIAKDISDLDKEIILRNRSIDPRLQHHLYRLIKSQNDRVLPPEPNSAIFYDDMVAIFGLISKNLLREKGKSFMHYSYVAVDWIHGFPYKMILDRQIAYTLQGKNLNAEEEKIEINRVIEELDDTIENKVKYDYTRGLKCYCDIIGKIISEDRTNLSYCEQLPTYLESGSSNNKILYMIGAGLSRNAAIEIFETLGEQTIPQWDSVTETMNWLRQNANNLRGRLHPIFFKELERILG
jgi:superfamily II DNA/RNA helicase